MERAEERAEEGAEERAEISILETQFRFQMPSIEAFWKRNSVSKSRDAMEGAEERAEEKQRREQRRECRREQRKASWKRNSVSRCPAEGHLGNVIPFLRREKQRRQQRTASWKQNSVSKMMSIGACKRNSVSKRRETAVRGEDSILETELRFQEERSRGERRGERRESCKWNSIFR